MTAMKHWKEWVLAALAFTLLYSNLLWYSTYLEQRETARVLTNTIGGLENQRNYWHDEADTNYALWKALWNRQHAQRPRREKLK